MDHSSDDKYPRPHLGKKTKKFNHKQMAVTSSSHSDRTKGECETIAMLERARVWGSRKAAINARQERAIRIAIKGMRHGEEENKGSLKATLRAMQHGEANMLVQAAGMES